MRPIHLARLDKARPVLILTRELVRPHLTRVTVAPITGTIRGLSTEVPVGVRNGLEKESVVSIDNMQVLDRCRHDPAVTGLNSFDFQLAKWAVKLKLPGAYHYLVSSFFFPPVRKKRTTLIPNFPKRPASLGASAGSGIPAAKLKFTPRKRIRSENCSPAARKCPSAPTVTRPSAAGRGNQARQSVGPGVASSHGRTKGNGLAGALESAAVSGLTARKTAGSKASVRRSFMTAVCGEPGVVSTDLQGPIAKP